ncbi:MAG: DMT family transporter [Prevotellaceae bacterium]|jgi:drug/metabolite transporter (DMT)-like permease|nr:DMT family transporter [Prevotellaceae bacterium]
MRRETKALLPAFAAVLCWSTIGSAFRLTLNYLPPHQLIFYSIITSLFFTAVVILSMGTWRILFSYTAKQYLSSALIALINPFIYYLLLLNAYNMLPTQVAGTINYIWPILLVLLSALILKQKIGFRTIAAFLISFFGLVLIVTRGQLRTLQFSNPIGVALILCGSSLFALYWIFHLKDKRDEAHKLILTYFFAALYLIPVQFILNPGWTIPPIKGLAGAIYIGFFEMGLAFFLWLKALKLTTHTAKISNLVFLSPFISLFFISIFVGEAIAFTTFAGLILIVVGIILSNTKTKNTKAA